MYLNPVNTRISRYFMLSDFMGCDSVYRYGFRNRFDAKFTEKLRQGAVLGRFLDEICEKMGPLEVSYGYISPELSQKIVKYQDPNKPSYHRWDLGAAADVCLNARIDAGYSPIELAMEIDDQLGYSRMITYAESEWICMATKAEEEESGEYRRALYENRYVGVRKPKYIRYSANEETRKKQKDNHTLEHDWRGKGWPSYHGGGRRQYNHYRVSKFSHVSSFLYNRDLVHQGKHNNPPLKRRNEERWKRWWRCARMAGAVLDQIAIDFNSRVSVISAYDRTKDNWDRNFEMDLVLPEHADVSLIAETILRNDVVSSVGVRNGKVSFIRVVGHEV